jgi:hypothetical protein
LRAVQLEIDNSTSIELDAMLIVSILYTSVLFDKKVNYLGDAKVKPVPLLKSNLELL